MSHSTDQRDFLELPIPFCAVASEVGLLPDRFSGASGFTCFPGRRYRRQLWMLLEISCAACTLDAEVDWNDRHLQAREKEGGMEGSLEN